MSRILFVTDSLFPLGTAMQLRIFAKALSCEGHEIHIAAFEERWETKLVDHFPFAKVYGLNKGKVRAGRAFVLAARLRRLINELVPDQVHGWCDPAASICGLALANHQPITFHTTELWKRPEKGLTQYLFERRFATRPEAIHVPHESLKEHLVEVQNQREHRIQVRPNAVEQPKLGKPAARRKLRERFGFSQDAKVAVAVAPLLTRTRLKDLIWAIDLIACVIPDVHFLILGEGIQEQKLRHFLSLTEVNSLVQFLGNDPDAADIVRGANLYWHSHLNEPNPAGLMWAMACEVPVISVYGPETRELIVPQVTGLATNFGARDEFARWTKYLLEIPDAAEQLARQGREHIEKKFSADH